MYLEQLQVSNVRVIDKATLTFSPRLNLIYGANGAGKTSLLEAIHLLGVGRSFRNHQIKHVIAKNKNKLTIFGKLSAPGFDTLGISEIRQGSSKLELIMRIKASYLH